MLTSLLIPISVATLFIPFEVLLALGSANMLLVIVVGFKYWARLWSIRLKDFKCLDISVWRIFQVSSFVLFGSKVIFSEGKYKLSEYKYAKMCLHTPPTGMFPLVLNNSLCSTYFYLPSYATCFQMGLHDAFLYLLFPASTSTPLSCIWF